MKKIIFTSAIIFATVAGAWAQGPVTGIATLNVKLNPIQTIQVNSAQSNVDLEYISTEDYSNGVTETKGDHLTVYSAGGFSVSVKAEGDLKRVGGTETIAASSINIKATKGSTAELTGTQYFGGPLSTTENKLIESTLGGAGRKFDVIYAGADNSEYMEKYMNGETPTVYTTTVTYTIAAN